MPQVSTKNQGHQSERQCNHQVASRDFDPEKDSRECTQPENLASGKDHPLVLVASVDRVYAFDRLRDMCRAAPRSVRRVRTRLTAPPESASGLQAAAEGTLLLDGDLIVCAGVTATTMR